ncbi:MAG: hypothetical protein JNJ64_11815 [Flavobacteriales bacterium]|nr:hypothetical protein [Flavobacteriales bacterium]
MFVGAKGNRAVRTLAGALLVLSSACGSTPDPWVVQPSPVEVSTYRLDQLLFHSPPDSLAGANLRAYADLGDFHRTYVEEVLQAAPMNDPRLSMALMHFTRDPDWAAAQAAADSIFGDMAPERAAFGSAFGRLRTLFPDSLVPRVVIFNAGYNYGIFPTDSVLGVGIEWFIGADHPVVGLLAPEAFPNYVKRRMVPDMLVPAAMKGWLMVHYLRDASGEDLLTQMVEVGKVMVLLDALLPDARPDLKLAFTPEQLAWCEANEFNIWRTLVSEGHLFSKDPERIAAYLNDGPFTNGLPRESPGHIGEWIGLRMVQAYLKEHPGTRLPDLFNGLDARTILKAYKPRD